LPGALRVFPELRGSRTPWGPQTTTGPACDYPLTISDALLSSEAMRRACATRNFREIFRLVNRRTGSSHADMAAAIGKMTSSRVSDIIRGVRGIRGQHVVERVADGIGIPGATRIHRGCWDRWP
jgi:hypothetical protein